MDSIKPYSKAIAAVVGAVITALVNAFPDSPDVARWCAFASTILTALAVYLVPNKDDAGTHQDESTQPPAALAAEQPGPDVTPTGYWGGV